MNIYIIYMISCIRLVAIWFEFPIAIRLWHIFDIDITFSLKIDTRNHTGNIDIIITTDIKITLRNETIGLN